MPVSQFELVGLTFKRKLKSVLDNIDIILQTLGEKNKNSLSIKMRRLE